jgi:hypothetical protein
VLGVPLGRSLQMKNQAQVNTKAKILERNKNSKKFEKTICTV